jgi:hypothetical protein
MSVNYSTTVATARLEAVRSALNAGSPPGLLTLMTAGSAALVSVPLDNTIGAPVGKVLTVISAAKQGTASAPGTATQAKLTNAAAVTVADGLTVSTTAGDVVLNDNVLQNGSQVTINSGTITTP